MKERRVTGIARLPNGDFFVLDSGSRRLISFDRKYNFQDSRLLPVFCHGIAEMDGKCVSITCGKNVLFYSLQNGTLQQDRHSFGLGGMGYDIAHRNNRFAVLCQKPSEGAFISITDNEGVELGKISQASSKIHLTQSTRLSIHKGNLYICIPETREIWAFTINDAKFLTKIEELRWTPRCITSTRYFIIVYNVEQRSLCVFNRSRQSLVTIWRGSKRRFDDTVEHMCFDSERSLIILYTSSRGHGSAKAIQIEE